jgi:hypothetical protein
MIPPPCLSYSQHSLSHVLIHTHTHIMTNLSTDKWQQAYRFLGVYIDCTNSYGGGDGHSHDDNQNNNNGGEEQGCARWAMWAAVSEKKDYLYTKKMSGVLIHLFLVLLFCFNTLVVVCHIIHSSLCSKSLEIISLFPTLI